MNITEKRLILACSRINLSSTRIQEIRTCVSGVSDWQNIFHTSTSHGICPLVYRSLKTACNDLIPDVIHEQFKALCRSNAEKNLAISASLLTILEIFKSHDILAVPFKGPILAEQAYGNIDLRMFSDLDIFIKEKDAIRAKKLLAENSYIADVNLSPLEERRYLEFENSFSFYHPKGGPDIDLHWELTGRYLLKPVYLNPLDRHLKSTDFMGRKLFTLPPDLMLVYLCVHGTSHCWERLEWLCSFSEMVNRRHHLDLSDVLTLAETMGCKRMLYLGLLLCNQLLGTKIPGNVMNEILHNRGVVKACKKIKNMIFAPKTITPGDAAWRFSPLHIQLRDTFSDRVKYSAYLYTAPTVKEWMSFPLRHWLTPVYRIIRPFRLVISYFMGKRNVKRT